MTRLTLSKNTLPSLQGRIEDSSLKRASGVMSKEFGKFLKSIGSM